MHKNATTTEDAGYAWMVAQLIAEPAPRFAFDDQEAALVQKVLGDATVRAHYADRCVSVACETGTEVTVACIASALGLEPNEGAIGTVLNDLATHARTLIVLRSLDAIYSPADPEQQEATDVMLATLASVDGLTLVITLHDVPRPECVSWTSTNDTTNETRNTVVQPALFSSRSRLVVTAADDGYLMLTPEDSNAPQPLLDGNTNNINSLPESKHLQASPMPRTMAQSKVPPPKPAVFHGRDKELERLVAHTIAPSTAPVGIVGPGGIGKTTLALNVLHEERVKQHFGRHRFFLTCEGSNGPDEVLGQLASKLDIKRSQDMPLWPAVLENLRSRQRVFLVLDNFESIWSPTKEGLRDASEVFLAQLAVLDEVTLLITTRGNLLPESFAWANVDTAHLDTLSSTAACLTFTDLSYIEPHILQSEMEASALAELLREIDFMPLAITLLARLDDLPSRLLREWSEHYTAVLEADRHDGTRRELSVEVSIKITLAHLPAESADARPRQLLSVMGQLPAGLFPGILNELLSIIPNLDSAARDLLRHSLVYTGGHGELRMLSPVRHYVSECLLMSDVTFLAVETIYVGIAHAHPSQARYDADGPAYDVELPNVFNILTAALDQHGDEELAWAVLSLAAYCVNRNQSCLQLLLKLLPRVDYSRENKARCQTVIGMHYYLAGELHLGVRFLEQSAILFEELGDKSSEATSRKAMALLLMIMGQKEDADQQTGKAQLLMQESSDFSYETMPAPGEDPMLAERRFRAARDACLRDGDGPAFISLSDPIMKIVRERGDTNAYTKELELVIALGEQMLPESQWLGVMKTRLSYQYMKRGNVSDAENLLIEAYALMSQHNERIGLALVTRSLSGLRAFQFRFSEGAELAAAAARLYRECGDARSGVRCDEEAELMRTRAAMDE